VLAGLLGFDGNPDEFVAAAKALGTIALGLLRPSEGASTAVEPIEGAFATADGVRWGEVTSVWSDGGVDLCWLDDGSKTTRSAMTATDDYLRPADLRLVVARRSDLVPAFEGWAGQLVATGADVALAAAATCGQAKEVVEAVLRVPGVVAASLAARLPQLADLAASTESTVRGSAEAAATLAVVIALGGATAEQLRVALEADCMRALLELQNPSTASALAKFATQSPVAMQLLLSQAQSVQVIPQKNAAAALAAVLVAPQTTAGQLGAAVVAGCISALVGLLRSGDAEEFIAAAMALQRIGFAMRPAEGASTSAKLIEGAFATVDGVRWGIVQSHDWGPVGRGPVALLWLDDGSDSGGYDDRIKKATLQAVVAHRSDLVAAFEGWASQILEAGCVAPLLAAFSPHAESDQQVAAAGLIVTLCRQATLPLSTSPPPPEGDQAQEQEHSFARRLVAAGLDKGALVAAVAAIGVNAIKGECNRWDADSPSTIQAKHRLEQLLKDTVLLSVLANAAQVEAEAEAEAAEAIPLTEEATFELVQTRMARMVLQDMESMDSMDQHIAAIKEQQFYEDCSLSPDLMPLAAVLAPQVLICRRHRAATVGMVGGGKVPCDCSLFVARFQGTNRPRDQAAQDVQPWRCSNCRAGLTKERVLLEEVEKMRCEREDADASGGDPHAHRLRSFGLSVEFILAVTVAFDCWTWPTWKVQRDIIRPLCLAGGRCRFAELPWVMSHVAPADVFISHTWGAAWGTLVVAALDGAAPGRKVWVDNVAVRQFPGNAADLDFDGVIERCQAVLLVAQALPGVAGLEYDSDDSNDSDDSDHSDSSGGYVGPELSSESDYDDSDDSSEEGSAFAIPKDERPLVAACRAWCLAEVNAAMKHKKPLVVKAGSAARSAPGGAVVVRFLPDAAMLRIMQKLIDVESADANVPADKAMIMDMIRQEPGGTAAMDLQIVAALRIAHKLAQLSPAVAAAIDAFLCGEPAQLGLLNASEKAEALRGSAVAGQVAAVQVLLAAGAGTELVDADGRTGLFLAAMNKHWGVVMVLAGEGEADLEANDHGETALHLAAENGETVVVRALLQAGANTEARDGFNSTALMQAAKKGHLDTVRALLPAGADIQAKSQNGRGRTALEWAERHKHPEVTSLLQEAAAAAMKAIDAARAGELKQLSVFSCAALGSQLRKAAVEGRCDVIQVLLQAGVDLEATDGDGDGDGNADYGGQTALILAAEAGQADVVRVLLQAGADPEAASFGRNALGHAEFNDHPKVVGLLREVMRYDEVSMKYFKK
jgi:ankyrin repeat protein